jgi:hypothetical protein
VEEKDMSHSITVNGEVNDNNPKEVQANLKVFVNNSSLANKSEDKPLFDK